MTQETDWFTFATTPPTTQDEFDRLAQALDDAQLETQVEENPARLCENDPAFWLRVRWRDLPLARELARKVATAPAKD